MYVLCVKQSSIATATSSDCGLSRCSTHGIREAHFIHNRHSTRDMFKKPLGDTKTSGNSIPLKVDTLIGILPSLSLAPLRSSERRKLRARTAERFRLAPEVAENLVPEGLLSQKFSAYNGETGVRVRSLWTLAAKNLRSR
jgi:hypothetical protein